MGDLTRFSESFVLDVDHDWLLLPVDNNQKKSKLQFTGENFQQEVIISLGERGSETWMSGLDVRSLKGKQLRISCEDLPDGYNAVQQFVLSDSVPAVPESPLRPLCHFTAEHGWLNDPNGLSYYQGYYHLFFQHNPYGIEWGNMSWGHAISKDLFHWTDLGDALIPDSLGFIFSGSAVVDEANTSGFGRDGIAPLVLIYTSIGVNAQSLAYSLDGIHFTKYDGNPVLPEITSGNRDPKIIWHEPTKRWIMVLYVERGKTATFEFWTSENLKNWKYLSAIRGPEGNGPRYLCECPDFFELPVPGTNETRWIISGADGEYSIGTFDGTQFVPESGPFRAYHPQNTYAAQTFFNTPDKRRIRMIWARFSAGQDACFNQGMTLPQVLELAETADGLRLAMTPLTPKPAGPAFSTDTPSLVAGDKMLLHGTEAFELDVDAELSANAILEFSLRGVSASFHVTDNTLVINEQSFQWPVCDGNTVHFRFFADNCFLECFSKDGLHYAAASYTPACPPDDADQTFVRLAQGQAKNVSLILTPFGR